MTSFDGAAYAQLTSRLLSRQHFQNSIAGEKDSFHDTIRIIDESAQKDSDWKETMDHLIEKRYSFVKDCAYSTAVKCDWLDAQQLVIDKDGSQGGSGDMELKVVVRTMPYAPTRAVHETDCLETILMTAKASMCV